MGEDGAMQDDHDPIIATRRSREPQREDRQPLWRLMLALGVGVAFVVLSAWWWMSNPSSDGASTTAQSTNATPESLPEEHVEQATSPPARDLETTADSEQAPTLPPRATEPAAVPEPAATPENPQPVPDSGVQASELPAPLSVRFMSPDPQVRIELRSTRNSSPALTSKAGGVVTVTPGTYRVVASGTQLETFVQEVTFNGEQPMLYTVELCAERRFERESLAGKIIEERACATTAQCESMFTALNEQAEQLVRDRSFRTRQCATWRSKAAPIGKWTLNTDCGGATLATTCRIEIAEGACTVAEPRRSTRGGACPRVGLK